MVGVPGELSGSGLPSQVDYINQATMIGHANWEYASGRGLVGQSQSIVSHFQDRDVVASGVDSNKETSVSCRDQGILRL